MTRREHLNNLSDEDFAEYINSVFIAGKIYGTLRKNYKQYDEDYIDWLKEDYSGE